MELAAQAREQDDHDDDDYARQGREPPGRGEVLAPFGDEQTPLRGRRRGPEAQEAQARDGQDRHAEVHRQERQDGTTGIGQDVLENDRPIRAAVHEGGFHVV
ncbi:hypothetical protein D9M73_245440 [compost metagenome]